MGLDSHLSGRRSYWGNDRPNDEEGFYVEAVEVYLGYWRKDYALQDYVTENFGEGNDGSGPIDLSLEQLHQILEALPEISSKDDSWKEAYDDPAEAERRRLSDLEDTKAMITSAIAFLTIDTMLPPPKMLWRTVFWHASW